MELNELKDKWKALVVDNSMELLLAEMKTKIPLDSPKRNDFYLISSQYSNLMRKLNMGILKEQEEEIGIVNHRFLNFISTLREEDLAGGNAILMDKLFGTEWELEDYYRWLEKKLNFHKTTFIQYNKTEQNLHNEFESHIRITSAHIGSRYYDSDTLFIDSTQYSFKFTNPQIDSYSKTFSPDFTIQVNPITSRIFLSLDIISEVAFAKSEDEHFELISPDELYLVRIFTNGKHIDYDGFLVDVFALTFCDKTLCLTVLNALQYIIDKRNTRPFDTLSGKPHLSSDE